MMNRSSLFRYLVVGSVAYLIEMGVLFALNHGLGLSPIKSVAISFWVGLVVAFLLQKLVTFKNYANKASDLAGQLSTYGLLVAWNYGFTLLMVSLLDKRLSVFIIRTLVIVIVTSWNFLIYAKIFRVRENHA